MTNWTDQPDYEPMSLRETSPRQSPFPFPRRVSDERPTFADRIADTLWPLCIALMALALIGSAVLLWLAR